MADTGTPALCKMVNTSEVPASAQARRVVAKAVALDVRDKRRLRKILLLSEGNSSKAIAVEFQLSQPGYAK